MCTRSLILNYISLSQFIAVPPMIAGGILLRIDLRRYVRDENDLNEWLKLWEELAFDPSFSRLVTRDTIRFLSSIDRSKIRRTQKRTVKVMVKDRYTKTIRVDHPGGDFVYPDDSGRVVKDLARYFDYEAVLFFKAQYRDEVIEEEVIGFPDDVDVVRLDSRSIDPIAFLQLQRETHSFAPVVEHGYFKGRVFNTVKFANLFQTIYGGLYYEFAGIKRAADLKIKDAADLDVFFSRNLGIGDGKNGSAERLFDEVLKAGDRAVVKFKSGVSGMVREVLAFHVPVATPPINAVGMITGDPRRQDIDGLDHPAATLLKPRRQGREGIFPKSNGLHYFIMTNGQNNLVDAVPQDIANDRTIPAPHPPILEAGRSCLICHSVQGESGWQPINNDLLQLTSGPYGLDIFDDRGNRRVVRFSFEAINRLIGKYKGQIDLREPRNSLAAYTLRAVGQIVTDVGDREIVLASGWREGADWRYNSGNIPDQTQVCKLAAERVHEEYKSRVWEVVKAKTALHELGLSISDEANALNAWRQIITPDPASFNGVFIEEDFRIGAISTDVGLNRNEWDLVKDFAAERAGRSQIYQKLRKQEIKK